MNNKCCRTCKYHDDFTWACFNGDSIHRADFTNDDFVCDAWEEQDGFEADK
jgi:hypothetical protein